MIETLHPACQSSNNRMSELWLQMLWKRNAFAEAPLFTTDNDALKIVFPGWYNRGWGPDFKESRILIAGREYFGDIEIHIDEISWIQHAHHQNESYNKVILHVFVNPCRLSITNSLNQPVNSLCLRSPSLDVFWSQNRSDRRLNIKELPGVCGIYLNQAKERKLFNIIQQAAEERLIKKSYSFKNVIASASLKEMENSFYTSICKSLGYSVYSDYFVRMSERFPYEFLKGFFCNLQRQSRVEILSRWFGYLGLLEPFENHVLHQDLRREWISLSIKWNGIDEAPVSCFRSNTAPFRPLNHPIRRLVGLYNHLYATHFKGLLFSWLSFLNSCYALINVKNSRSKLLKELDCMFPQSTWDPFCNFKPTSRRQGGVKRTRFIGRQRQLVILVNSVIPFFLAWSRANNDGELESLLFTLILVLPSEGKNRKTDFMENRLFNDYNPIKLIKNLSYHQGLIQIHDECCTSFYEGCCNCSLYRRLHDG